MRYRTREDLGGREPGRRFYEVGSVVPNKQDTF